MKFYESTVMKIADTNPRVTLFGNKGVFGVHRNLVTGVEFNAGNP